MAKVNGEYWAQRIAELEEKLLLSGEDYLKRLGSETAKAIRRTEADIARWYNRFAKNNKITLAEAKKWLTAKELKELRWTVDEYIEYAEANELDPRWVKELENASARVHISRLEALKLDLRHSAEAIGAFQKNGAVKVFETVYKDGYFRIGFEFQRAIGFGWSLGSGVDEERIRKVLAAPWTTDGKTFSDRIWSNQEALVSELSTALTQMIMRGEGPLETADTIAKKFNVNRSRAATLVYTESAAFAELSRNDCYSNLGVEMCRVDGTLDGATCANCGAMDGTVLRLADCKVGVSTPPFHPRCRCTTVPHYDDWDEFDITLERIARNIDTGEHFEVPANMTYEQWKAEQEKIKKRVQGERIASASEEYNKLSQVGLHRLPSIDKFAEMRYNDNAEYKKIIKRYENLSGQGLWRAVEFNPETLASHYIRHNKDFDVGSSREYEEKALSFVNGNIKKDLIIREDLSRCMYSESKNMFAVISPDGTVSTFYKPKSGKKYWEGQKRKYEK